MYKINNLCTKAKTENYQAFSSWMTSSNSFNACAYKIHSFNMCMDTLTQLICSTLTCVWINLYIVLNHKLANCGPGS